MIRLFFIFFLTSNFFSTLSANGLELEHFELPNQPGLPWVIKESGRYKGHDKITIKSKDSPLPLIIIEAEDVTLENFEFENELSPIILCKKCRRLTLDNVTISNSPVAFDGKIQFIKLERVLVQKVDSLFNPLQSGPTELRIVDGRFYGPFKNSLRLEQSSYSEFSKVFFDFKFGEGLSLQDSAVLNGYNLIVQNCNDQCVKTKDLSKLYFANTTITKGEDVGIFVQGESSVFLQEAKVESFSVGTLAIHRGQLLIQNSRFSNNSKISILGRDFAKLNLANSRLEKGMVGVKVRQNASIQMAQNDFTEFYGVAISLLSSSEMHGDGNRIFANYGAGLQVNSTGSLWWVNNVHEDNLLQGMELLTLMSGMISGNTIRGNRGDGVYIEKRFLPSLLENNIIEDNGQCNVQAPKEFLPAISRINVVSGSSALCPLPLSLD